MTVACGVAADVPPPSTGASPESRSGPEIAFVHVANPGGPFTLDVPVGWQRSGDPRHLRFRQGTNTIDASVEPQPVAPDVSTARGSEVPSQVRGSPLVDIVTATRPSGPVIRIRFPSDGATGERLLSDRYLFWRRGLLCRLTLTGPTGAAAFDPAGRISRSFTWRP